MESQAIKSSELPYLDAHAPMPQHDVLVSCPMPRAAGKYRVIRAVHCVECEFYKGMTRMCLDDSQPYSTCFTVTCVFPMTRKLTSLEIYEP